jgi:hypothetical protein
MSRAKTGGRQCGTPNHKTADIREKLAAMGCDPIAGMAAIAMDEKQDIGLRAQMFKELAQYVAPKRKAIEMAGADGEELTLADLVNGSYELERRQRAAGELIDQSIASHFNT